MMGMRIGASLSTKAPALLSPYCAAACITSSRRFSNTSTSRDYLRPGSHTTTIKTLARFLLNPFFQAGFDWLY